MNLRDFYSHMDVRTCVSSGGKTSTATGAPVDLIGASGVVFLFCMGASVSGGTFNWTVEDSDDGVTFATVAAKFIKADAPNPLGESWCYRVGYIGKRRYARARATYVSGTSQQMAIVAILRPLARPVA